MINRISLIILFALVAAGLNAQQKEAPKKAAPSPSLTPVQDVAGLPRVLLIGDSISMGYTLPVRKLLEGKANVHRIPTNGGPSSKGVAEIGKWLGDGKWAVIHFNFGIHDLKFMPDGKRQVEPAEYEKNLRELVGRMKATGATVIWATTTPIPVDLPPPGKFGDVKAYNDIARKIMEENAVKTDDLNSWITPGLAKLQIPQNVHFHPEGSEFLAKKVASEIEGALPKK